MKMRRELFLFVIIAAVSLITNSFHLSAGQLDTQGLQENVDSIKDKGEQLKEFTDKDRWEYLSEEWKKVILKSKFFGAIDSTLHKIDTPFLAGKGIFYILMKQDYELGLLFFFVLFYWVFFAVARIDYSFLIPLTNSIEDKLAVDKIMIPNWYLTLEKILSLIIGMSGPVIMAHLGWLRGLANITIKLLFSKEGFWGWIWFILFLIVYVVFLVYIKKIVKKITGASRKKREERRIKSQVESNTAFIQGEKKALK